MIETILVATDGSDAAAHAERFGVALAARTEGALLRHLGGGGPLRARLPRGRARRAAAAHRSASRQFLRQRAEACRRAARRDRARENGVECTVRDRCAGSPTTSIVERGQPADLIVLGRDGQDAELPHRADRLDRGRRDAQDQQARARRAGVGASSRARSCSRSTARRARASRREPRGAARQAARRADPRASSTRRTRGARWRASTRCARLVGTAAGAGARDLARRSAGPT